MYYNIAMVTTDTTDQSLPLLPLDIQSFQKIRKNDFLYIDKTGLIAQLIDSKLTYFFLSRPRRFGKSLLISTMKEIFSGNQELFKNLRVYNEIQWEPYPVIHFDFSLIAVDETTPVKNALADEVNKIAGDFHLPITKGNHKAKFRCHWYATGTPTVLIKAIRERKVKIQELDHIKEKRPKLENMEVTRLELIPLLFQTGYLTIIEKINQNLAMEEYILDYPNRDVRYSFLNHLLEDFSPGNPRLIDNIFFKNVELEGFSTC